MRHLTSSICLTLIILFGNMGEVRPQNVPDLSRLDSEAREGIELQCSIYNKTHANYARCVDSWVTSIDINEFKILDGETQESIESACSYAKTMSGPAPYAQCQQKQLSLLKNSGDIPDRSGLVFHCRRNGSANFERCINKHLGRTGIEPDQPPNVAPTPPQRTDLNKIVNASSGSGFAVSTTGHVITNNHVIKGCKTVKIHTKGKLIPAKVIAYDSKNDIALLKGEFKPSTFFRFSIDNAQLLQEIYVAGYPFGRNVSSSVKVTKGIVSALIGIKDNTNQIQIDAALQPGNSGGPIIDEAGNVVGIAVSKLSIERTPDGNIDTIPENTNFGVKSDIAKLLLLKNNVNLITPNIKPITTAKLGRLISDSTYYLSCWMTIAQIQKMRSEKVLFNNLD